MNGYVFSGIQSCSEDYGLSLGLHSNLHNDLLVTASQILTPLSHPILLLQMTV